MAVPYLGVAIVVVLCGIAAWRIGGAWWKYRGRGVVTCPENRKPAGVKVDLRYAMTTALARPPEIRLQSCSRWPEKVGCGQECLGQIAASPEGCLVHHILSKWYTGKVCRSCGLPIGDISLAGAKPAVLRADGRSVEWSDIPAEKLQETLSAAGPICFACHTARKMLSEHRELISGLPEASSRAAQ
ncbi:MAG: hypothetical protein ACLQKA_15305 [Bryobacteraceae bacterium]